MFDLAVQSGIAHHFLGGLWYAAALFYCWMKGATASPIRTRVLTTLAGLAIAIVLSMIATMLIQWPPPISPARSGDFPDYLTGNLNPSSFPSFSTAVYSSIAFGVYTLHRFIGSLLLAGIPILVALPRMYVGGHYATDVLVGFGLGSAGLSVAIVFVEDLVRKYVEPLFVHNVWRPTAETLVFITIWQIAVEFNEVIWAKRVVALFFQ